jgi:hypothetical protein
MQQLGSCQMPQGYDRALLRYRIGDLPLKDVTEDKNGKANWKDV